MALCVWKNNTGPLMHKGVTSGYFQDISFAAKEAAAGQLEAIKIRYEEALELRKKAELEIEVFRPVSATLSLSRISASNDKPAIINTLQSRLCNVSPGCRQSHFLPHCLGEKAGAAGG